jgi:hypothetical protein
LNLENILDGIRPDCFQISQNTGLSSTLKTDIIKLLKRVTFKVLNWGEINQAVNFFVLEFPASFFGATSWQNFKNLFLRIFYRNKI